MNCPGMNCPGTKCPSMKFCGTKCPYPPLLQGTPFRSVTSMWHILHETINQFLKYSLEMTKVQFIIAVISESLISP